MAEEIIIVQGTGVLAGEVPVSGAKNSALKLIAAALLGRHPQRAAHLGYRHHVRGAALPERAR